MSPRSLFIIIHILKSKKALKSIMTYKHNYILTAAGCFAHKLNSRRTFLNFQTSNGKILEKFSYLNDLIQEGVIISQLSFARDYKTFVLLAIEPLVLFRKKLFKRCIYCHHFLHETRIKICRIDSQT